MVKMNELFSPAGLASQVLFYNFDNFRCLNNRNLIMDDFLQKLRKVVRIVLCRLAINSQSDCGKAGPYQSPYNNQI